MDQEEIAAAHRIADEGAESAKRCGYNAFARIARANESVAKTISEVAHEIDARLIVCGQRGRGAIASAVLGSVSHQLSAHAERPVLIAPQHPARVNEPTRGLTARDAQLGCSDDPAIRLGETSRRLVAEVGCSSARAAAAGGASRWSA